MFVATSYVDDYKLRGQSPATNEVLAAFSTQERAEAYQRYWLEDYVYTRYEQNADPDGDTYAEYEQKDGVLRKDLADYELDELATMLSEGEFVPTSMEWEIREVTIDLMSTPLIESGGGANYASGEEAEESPLKKTRTKVK